VVRIAVHEAGNDFADRISHLENQALARNIVVFQVWLNLTEPCAGDAVDILRDRGYFFGGALPRWFDGDGLLMQKLLCPPDFDNIVLYSEEAKQLLKFIQTDWNDQHKITSRLSLIKSSSFSAPGNLLFMFCRAV